MYKIIAHSRFTTCCLIQTKRCRKLKPLVLKAIYEAGRRGPDGTVARDRFRTAPTA